MAVPILPLQPFRLPKKKHLTLEYLKADENNYITSFIEKPKKELLVDWASETGEAMQKKGKYTWPQWVFIFLTAKMLSRPVVETYPEDKDFGKEIIPKVIGNHKVGSYQYEGYWEDIGQISSFLKPTFA